MTGSDQELKEFQKKLQVIINPEHPQESQQLERPFFSKKVMRAIAAYESGRPSETYQRVYQVLRVALFMALLLFPTLTEAII